MSAGELVREQHETNEENREQGAEPLPGYRGVRGPDEPLNPRAHQWQQGRVLYGMYRSRLVEQAIAAPFGQRLSQHVVRPRVPAKIDRPAQPRQRESNCHEEQYKAHGNFAPARSHSRLTQIRHRNRSVCHH
jgi:hypothetical protein